MINVFKSHSFLLSKSLNQSWHIYVYGDSIFYELLDGNKVIEKQELVKDIDSFDIAVDNNNNIHIIYLTNQGELYYLKDQKKNWKKELLKAINTSTDKIEFLKIITLKKDIHIFYSFKYSFVNKNCTPNKLYLVHLYNNGQKWRYRYLASLLDINKKIQFFINSTKNDELLFFYSVTTDSKLELNYNILLDINLNWKGTKKIDLSAKTIKILTLYTDSKSNIHIIYKNKDDIRFTYHTIKNLDHIERDNNLNNQICCDENKDIKYNLFEFNSKLIINWLENNHINYMVSEDYGNSWSQPYSEGYEHFKEIKLVGNTYMQVPFSNIINTFSSIDKRGIYLVGINESKLPEQSYKSNDEEAETVKEQSENNNNLNLENEQSDNLNIKNDEFIKSEQPLNKDLPIDYSTNDIEEKISKDNSKTSQVYNKESSYDNDTQSKDQKPEPFIEKILKYFR